MVNDCRTELPEGSPDDFLGVKAVTLSDIENIFFNNLKKMCD